MKTQVNINLDVSKTFCKQDTWKVEQLRREVGIPSYRQAPLAHIVCEAVRKFPILNKYCAMWPIDDLMRARFKYKRSRLVAGVSAEN